MILISTITTTQQHNNTTTQFITGTYADRATFAKAEREKTMQSVLTDIESYENSILNLLPKRSILGVRLYGYV